MPKLSEVYHTPQMQAHIAGLGVQQREIFASQLVAAGYDREDVAGVIAAYPPQPTLTTEQSERFVRDNFLASGNSVQGTGGKFQASAETPEGQQAAREKAANLEKAFHGSGRVNDSEDPRQKAVEALGDGVDGCAGRPAGG